VEANMTSKLVEGRGSVVQEADRKISSLVGKLEGIIKGKESEYLFPMVYLVPNIFANLAKEVAHRPKAVNRTWLRAQTGMTLALNRVLPKFLPLKHPSKMHEKFEKISKEGHLNLFETFVEIGKWVHILENKNIDKIEIKREGVCPYYSKDKDYVFSKYVEELFAFSTCDEYTEWLDLMYRKIPAIILEEVDKFLLKGHGFRLNDLRSSSIYLEELAKKEKTFIRRNEIHTIFTKNIRHGRAERLLKALTFSESNNDLHKSPLIPVDGGYFLLAKWVLVPLPTHFHSWVKPVLEAEPIRGEFARFAGYLFEEYVSKKVKEKVDRIYENVIISEKDFPEIKPWLKKFRPPKAEKFEIDLLAVKNSHAFLISNKGGRKELPKEDISRRMAELPEKEILGRIRQNLKEAKEIKVESECIRSSKRIQEHFGLIGKSLVLVVVSHIPQPLSIPEIRRLFGPQNSDVKFLTIKELGEEMKKPD
jgi:hypothetical protein